MGGEEVWVLGKVDVEGQEADVQGSVGLLLAAMLLCCCAAVLLCCYVSSGQLRQSACSLGEDGLVFQLKRVKRERERTPVDRGPSF